MPIVIEARVPAISSLNKLTETLKRVRAQTQGLTGDLQEAAAAARDLNSAMGAGRGSRSRSTPRAVAGARRTIGVAQAAGQNRTRRGAMRPTTAPSMGRPKGAGGFGWGSVGQGASAAYGAVRSAGAGNFGAALSSAAGLQGIMAAVVNPVTAVVAAAVAGVATLAASAKNAADALGGIRASYVKGGGTPGQARGASVLGDYLGVDIAGVGKGLRDGYGSIVAGRAGVSPFGGPFGNDNYNAKGIKVARLINHVGQTNPGQARRYAEMAGAPELANAAFINPRLFDQLSNRKGPTMASLRGAAELGGQVDRLRSQYSDNFTTAWGPLIDVGTKVIKKLADLMESTAPDAEKFGRNLSLGLKILEKIAARFQPLFDFVGKIVDFVGSIMDRIYDVMKMIAKLLNIPIDEQRKQTRAADKFAQSVDKFDQAMKEGTYGGGSRATAGPSKWKPMWGMGNPTPAGVFP